MTARLQRRRNHRAMDNYKKRISSPSTWIYQIAFPGIWFATLVACGFLLYTAQVATPILSTYLLLFAVGSFILRKRYFCFKTVYLDAQSLHVQGLCQSERIPRSRIANVRWEPRQHPQQMTVELRTRSAFGNRIVFTPTPWPESSDSIHPVAAELLSAQDGELANGGFVDGSSRPTRPTLDVISGGAGSSVGKTVE